MVDLSSYLTTQPNNPAKDYSATRFNALVNAVETGINSAGGGSTLVSISVADYFASPRTPDVTDDLPAFVAALAALKALSNSTSGSFRASPKLIVPMGKYYLSDTLNIFQTVHIEGTGSGQPNAIGPLLRFAANKNGIVFNDYRTNNDAGQLTDTGLGDASGSILEGVSLWGGAAISSAGPFVSAANTSGHGIRIRCTSVKIADVFVAFFADDGINIAATAGTTGATQGNANTFHLERVWSTYNGRYGIFVSGNDANAGNVITASVVECAGGGIMDYSFLGNTYSACHIRDCGVTSPNTAAPKPVTVCQYGGLYYYVKAGQQVAASTTQPGTNAAVWATYAGFGGPAWVTGMDWITGSPYGTNPANVNARNVFVGCYAESGQPPVQATAPSLFIGGILDEVTVVGSAVWLSAGSGRLIVPGLEPRTQASIPVSGLVTTWNATTPGTAAGTFHFLNSNASAGGAITWATASESACAGVYAIADNAFGSRLLIATTDSFAVGAKTAISIDELGHVDLVRGNLKVAGTKVLGAQGAAVADATGGATVDAEARSAINAVIARLEAHGLIAT